MVVRLEGKVQGKDVIFNRVVGDVWETIIPPSLNGVYIVELTAYDDAGNMAYTSRYILTVDMSALCVKLELCRWQVDVHMKKWCVQPRLSHYYGVTYSDFGSKVKLSRYHAKVRCCKC